MRDWNVKILFLASYPQDEALFRSSKIHTIGDFFHAGDLDKFVENVFSGTEKRANAVKYLMDKKEWDLFVTVFRGTDSIG